MSEVNETSNSTWGLLRKILWRLLSIVGFLLIISIILLAFMVGTAKGREWVVEDIVPSFLKSSGIQLHVHQLAWPRLGQLQFAELEVAMADGTSVNAHQGLLSIDLKSLRERQLLVNDVKLNKLQVNLAATTENVQTKSPRNKEALESQLNALMDQLVDLGSVRLRSLTIDKFELTQADRGQQQGKALIPAVGISASGSFNNGEPLVVLDIGTHFLEPQSGQLSLKLSGRSLTEVNLQVGVQDKADAWLSTLVQLPHLTALDAQLNVSADVNGNQVNAQIKNLSLPLQDYDISLRGKAQLNWVENLYQWQDVILTTNELEHQTSGQFSQQYLTTSLILDRFPIDLAKLFVDIPIQGVVSSDVEISGSGNQLDAWKGAGLLEIKGQYENFPFSLKSNVGLSDQVVKLNTLSGNIADAILTGNGQLSLSNRDSDFTFSLANIHSDWLEKLGVYVPIQQEWLSSVQGGFKGDYLKPVVQLNVSLEGELEQQVLASNVLAHIDFNQSFSEPFVDLLNAEMQWGETLFSANGYVDLRANATNELKTRLSGFSLGQVKKLDTKRLSKDFPSIEPLYQLLQNPEIAAADFTLSEMNSTLTGTFGEPEIESQISLNAVYQQQAIMLTSDLNFSKNILTIPRFQVESLLGHIDISKGLFNLTNQNLQADLSIRDVNIQTWLDWPFINQYVQQSARSELDKLEFLLNAKASINGNVASPRARVSVKGEGKYQEEPLNVYLDIEDVSLEKIDNFTADVIWADDVHLDAKGSMTFSGDSQMEINLSADPIPELLLALGKFPAQKNPQLKLNGKLNGDFRTPKVNANLTYNTSLVIPSDEVVEPELWPLSMTVDINSLGDHIKLDVEVIDKAKQNLSLKGKIAQADYEKILTSPSEQWVSNLPLDMQVKGALSLEQMGALIQDDNHQLEGEVSVDLVAAGTIEEPMLNGSLQILEGGYSNPLLGITTRDADILLTAKDQVFFVEKANIKDQASGRIRLNGKLDWGQLFEAVDGAPIDFTLSTRRAKLVERGDVEATVSGDLNLKGDLKNLDLTGELDVTPLAIFLDALVQNNVPQIEINEIAKDAKVGEEEASAVNLDLKINANQQANIYGKGINTEIGGGVTITGNANSPNVSGNFETIRGRFEVLGKLFRLEQGQVRLENESVFFNLTGFHQARDDTEITAIVTGNLEKLELQLRSSPSLPEDEIISRLLFGKTSGDITPFQALSLAKALDQLRTGGTSTLDIVGNTREALGVDSLNIDETQTEDGETQLNVSIGKYVNDKVYLELEPGFGEGESLKGTVEIELTPSISLESFAGSGKGFGGIELIWKNDY